MRYTMFKRMDVGTVFPLLLRLSFSKTVNTRRQYHTVKQMKACSTNSYKACDVKQWDIRRGND
jgi:hypothetical protein